MKLRSLFILAVLSFALAACNFTLAADVTPPPGYVPPTAAPTLGAMYPAALPDYHNGAKIYTTECAPCHGNTGMGDGSLSSKSPVSIPALGVSAVAQKAAPSAWYKIVTQGNMERVMPPFESKLSNQERWDVVAYSLLLHMSPEQIETGRALFEANCADCAKYFSNAEMMAALSENDLIQMMRNGGGMIPAFGKNFSDEEAAAVAVYIRTLTFAPPPAMPTATSAPEAASTLEPADATPSGTESAAAESTGTAEPVAGIGNVKGSVENQTGAALPADAKVILHVYDHSGDMNSGPAEIQTLETTLAADGSYIFENVEIPEKRIFVAEVVVNGSSYQSDFALVEAGMTEVAIAPILIYASTDDFSTLKVPSLQIFFDFANENDVQVFAVYAVMNDGDKTIMVNMGEKEEIPFLAFPQGATQLGYEASQDSAPFTSTDNGFAMPPSAAPYGLIAFSSVAKSKEITISQPALLDIDQVTLFLPEGVDAKGKSLTDEGVQPIQGMNFHVYTAGKIAKGAALEFTLSGKPAAATAVNPDVTQNKNLLIGVGAFGVVLILLGAWLFIRDRNKIEEEDDAEDEDALADTEDVMDAIIALDDLHRAGKISDEAYQTRRAELKAKLKKG